MNLDIERVRQQAKQRVDGLTEAEIEALDARLTATMPEQAASGNQVATPEQTPATARLRIKPLLVKVARRAKVPAMLRFLRSLRFLNRMVVEVEELKYLTGRQQAWLRQLSRPNVVIPEKTQPVPLTPCVQRMLRTLVLKSPDLAAEGPVALINATERSACAADYYFTEPRFLLPGVPAQPLSALSHRTESYQQLVIVQGLEGLDQQGLEHYLEAITRRLAPAGRLYLQGYDTAEAPLMVRLLGERYRDTPPAYLQLLLADMGFTVIDQQQIERTPASDAPAHWRLEARWDGQTDRQERKDA